jgi:hypothetical protein
VQSSQPIVVQAESLRKRVKEALTSLEFLKTTKVTPSGGQIAPLEFGYYIINPNDTTEFLNYAEKEVFPYNEFLPDIDALSTYSGMNKDDYVVWKVRRNGIEDPGLRYDDKWNLEESGPVVKRINSWYVLLPGLYELDIYVNGELLQSGSFEISTESQLKNPLPDDLQPAAPVSVNTLFLHETFDNNNANWWTGSGLDKHEGQVAGELEIVTHNQERMFTSSCTFCGTTSNFYIEADARYVSGPVDRGYGLVYRGEVNFKTFYTFLISPNGYYLVGRYDNGWTILVNWTESDAIVEEATNRIGVACRGPDCDFFVNGELIDSIRDDSLTGLFAGVRVDAAELRAAFDNVNIWSLQ